MKYKLYHLVYRDTADYYGICVSDPFIHSYYTGGFGPDDTVYIKCFGGGGLLYNSNSSICDGLTEIKELSLNDMIDVFVEEWLWDF